LLPDFCTFTVLLLQSAPLKVFSDALPLHPPPPASAPQTLSCH
jgi:hypothetical protein